VRLNEPLETVELKVMDTYSKVDEAVMLAGLARGLVPTCHERAEREEPYPMVRPEFLRAANACASRYGLDADLLDMKTAHIVPVQETIEKLPALARPGLEEVEDWEEVAFLARETPEWGNEAARQRKAYERAGRLENVAGMLIEETGQGMDKA
jgi:carboxylate-amine ligase